MMCNEPINNKKKRYEEELKDYRFIIYRLDQLESEEKENFKQLMQMLQAMQQGMNEQNKTIVELTQRQRTLEEKMEKVESLSVQDAKHSTEISNIYRRLNIYKAVLIAVTGSVLASVFLTIIK